MNRPNLVCLAIGGCFGFLFCAAGFNQYNVIHDMLLLRNWSPYLVMGSAVVTAMTLLWILERVHWRTPAGEELALKRWPVERKHVYGGIVFGIGWSITAACPGSISGMVGAGSFLSVITLAGFMSGMYLRDVVAERETAPAPAPPIEAPATEPVAVS